MFFTRWLAALLFATLALSSAPAQKNPEPAAAPDFSKEAYVIEHVTTRVRAENDGTGTREVSAAIKIIADAGVKTFAVLSFVYTSANEVVEIDYVRVRKPDGTLVKTPDYNIQDMPGEVTRTAPLYSDIHEKHIAVKALAVGDVLEYLVRYRVVKAEVPGQFWFEYFFTKNAIARDERLEINLPADKYLKVVSPSFKPEIVEESGQRVYRWSRQNLIVKEKDPFEIPRRIMPNPDVQVTTFRSWEEIGRWYGALQKEPLTVTPAIQAKAAELTKSLATDDEKIHALYNFVSLKYHYIGLDFGIGRYQPHAADDVLDNGYGDCKDKHTLLASLLKAVGIDAWPVLIHASRKLDPEVPSPAQFNHVITIVPRGASYVWLDTTPEVSPYGLLLQGLRNKQVLVVPTDQPARLMTTPENPPQPQRQEFSMAGKLGPDGTFTGHAEQTYEGDTEVLLRAAFRRIPESQWKDLVQRFSQGLSFAGDVSEVKITPPDELDKPFHISYDYQRKNFGDWENHHTIAPLPPIGIESPKEAKLTKPEEPVLLGAIGTLTYRSRVQLPDGYRTVAPPPVRLVQPYAEYDASTSVEDGVITTTRQLTIKKTEVPLSEWEDYRKFGNAIYDDKVGVMTLEGSANVAAKKNAGKEDEAGKESHTDGGPPAKLDSAELDSMFRDGSDALQRRDFQRAQELFEKIIANDPNYKGAHFNLGVTLAYGRTPTDAVEEFRKEEKVSPEDPRPYQAVATYMMRTNRRDESIQEWRKLLKVDPQNRTAASTLAALLYREQKYSDAVEVLETAIKTAPDSSGLQLQLGDAYVKAGQGDKAVATFRKLLEQKGDDPETLNEVSYTLADNKLHLDLAQQYGEKAVEKLEEQAQDAESSDDAGLRVTFQLSLVWDTLGWVYFQQGDAKRAEPLVRAAWLLGEEEIVAEHLGQIYEKEGKTQQAAHAYEMALAVSSAVKPIPGFPSSDSVNAGLKQEQEITARYQKLMGKKPSLEIRRLPNGEWTQTPAEQLRHTRELKLSNKGKITGSAKFAVTFKPGKVDSAQFVSGDENLNRMAGTLTAATYPLEFPPDSGAVLVMLVDVKCHSESACIATLVNPVAPSRAPAFAVQ